MVISCLAHDIGHFGVSNSFMVAAGSEPALVYNGVWRCGVAVLLHEGIWQVFILLCWFCLRNGYCFIVDDEAFAHSGCRHQCAGELPPCEALPAAHQAGVQHHREHGRRRPPPHALAHHRPRPGHRYVGVGGGGWAAGSLRCSGLTPDGCTFMLLVCLFFLLRICGEGH